jgi:hypothetical protein
VVIAKMVKPHQQVLMLQMPFLHSTERPKKDKNRTIFIDNGCKERKAVTYLPNSASAAQVVIR